jgi:hypothetical protein
MAVIEAAQPVRRCGSCGAMTSDVDTYWYEVGGVMTYLCPTCALDPARVREAQARGTDLRRAVIFGLAGGGIAATLWYAIVVATGLEIGLAATGIGALVAIAVLKGAGRHRSARLQVISLVITIAALALGEYLVVRHTVLQVITMKYGPQNVPLFFSGELVWELLVADIKSSPATLAFWAIAAISALQIPGYARVEHVGPAAATAS